MKHFALPLMLASFAMPISAHAADAALTDAQKKEVEAIVKQYILDNGGDIIQSVNNFQQKQEEETNKQAEVKAGELLAKIKADKTLASAGNPDGDITVVEFFDYHCGYCKKAFTEIQTLLKEDKNVRVVFYDMPILGPESYTASKWALAAKRQNKYFEFHKEAITHEGAFDADALKAISEKAGLDLAQMEKDVADPKIDEELKSHLEKAKELGIQGTPGFLIEDKIVRGYIPYDGMKASIEDARKALKKN